MLALGHYPGMEVANERGCGWKEAAALQPSWGNLRAHVLELLAAQIHKRVRVREKRALAFASLYFS